MRAHRQDVSLPRSGALLRAGAILLCGLLAGCTSVALRDSTVAVGATVTDLQYEMVLSNLAMFRQNQGALPWHLKITEGAVQITDTFQPSLQVAWPDTVRTGAVAGSRSWNAAWTVVPVVDHKHLAALQMVYQQAANDKEFAAQFEEGTIPGGAPFGRYGSKFVWVRNGQLEALTKLTLAILKTAPVDSAERAVRQPGVPLQR